MIKRIFFLVCFFPGILYAQTAIFYADTSLFYTIKSRNQPHHEIMDAEWIIHGQLLRYGPTPVVVAVDQVLDTILYRQRNNVPWDTILCNINRPGHFQFIYNECCGAFNLAGPSGRFIAGAVNFRVKGQKRKEIYLGTLGEAGILVKPESKDILQTGCRSAMSPNVYPMTLAAIEICKDTTHCDEGICLYEKGKELPVYDFAYRTRSSKLNCLFLPLSNEPIRVVYDSRTGQVTIE